MIKGETMTVPSSSQPVFPNDVQKMFIQYDCRNSDHSNYQCTITLKDSRKVTTYVYSIDIYRLIQDINKDNIYCNSVLLNDSKFTENLKYVAVMNPQVFKGKKSDFIF